MPLMPPRWRRAAGSVSPRPNAPSSSSRPISDSATKIPRQEVNASSWLPMIGARIGAMPLTIISSEKKRAWTLSA